AGCKRFVFVSSIAAMGFRSRVATPSSDCEPVSPYGRAKLAAERALLDLNGNGVDVVVLRPPLVYGRGERYNFLNPVRAVDRGLFRIIGRGRNVMPLCTSDNAARVAREAALGRVAPGIHLVADDDQYSMLRIQRAICAALGRRVPRVRIPVPVANVMSILN